MARTRRSDRMLKARKAMRDREKAEFGGIIDEQELKEWEDLAATSPSEEWAMPLWRAATEVLIMARQLGSMQKMYQHQLEKEQAAVFEEKRADIGW